MNKKLKAGFTLIIIQAVLLFMVAVFLLFVPTIIGIDSEYNYFWIGTLILGVISVLMILLCVSARKGKKGAAIAILVISAIISTVSFISIIGSILMLSARNEPVAEKTEEQKVQADTPTQPVAAEAAPAAVNSGAELKEGEQSEKHGKILGKVADFKSKFAKEDRGNPVKAFVIVTVFYFLVLALSLTSYFTYFFGVFGGSSLCKMISSMVIAFTPAYLVYLGGDNPFNFKKPVSVLLIILGVLGFAGCDALMVLRALESIAENNNYMIMIFAGLEILAQIAIIFCFTYLLTDWPYGLYTAFCILGPVLLPFISALVIAIIIIVALAVWALIVIKFFVELVSDDKGVKSFKQAVSGESPKAKEYTFINDMGCRQTVYSSDGKNFYNADGSYAGSSNDGGKTINYK